MKYTYHVDGTKPTNIAVFVFGSNLAGVHGAGAASEAYRRYGALYGSGVGLRGWSYAIPTKDKNIQTMSLDQIKPYVKMFLDFATDRPHLKFFITRIGCGLAGYNDSDIAPLFKGAPTNCNFPEEWESYIE
jgi:hypothetical protein